MNSKTFGILALVAVVLTVIAVVSQRHGTTDSIAGSTAGELFAPTVAGRLEHLNEIVLSGAGNTTLVDLERLGDGWVVGNEDSYPAAQSKINALLIALAEARIVEEKTADPAFFPRLGVEPVDGADAKSLGIALVGDDGQRLTLILGDASGSKSRYARLADSDQSVLIDRNPEVARTPKDWLDPEILAIPGKRVQQVEIRHADGERLVIHKDSAEQMNFAVDAVPEGRELQYASIADVTGNVLQDLKLEAVERAPEAPAEPAVTAEFRTFDGLVISVESSADRACPPPGRSSWAATPA